ncbi:MAG: hypothetical protein ABH870_00580 [bacterium]
MAYMLDTNIITALLKGNEKVRQQIRTVRLRDEKISINALSYYDAHATSKCNTIAVRTSTNNWR